MVIEPTGVAKLVLFSKISNYIQRFKKCSQHACNSGILLIHILVREMQTEKLQLQLLLNVENKLSIKNYGFVIPKRPLQK